MLDSCKAFSGGLCIAALLALAPSSQAAFSLQLDLGILADAAQAPALDGSLLQLVASPGDAVFTAPTPGSFTGDSSDDVVIAQWSLSGSSFLGAGSGSDRNFLSTLSTAGLPAGTPLALRWYPSLDETAVIPGTGTPYGELRPVGSDGTPLTVPADGATISAKALTLSAFGILEDSMGFASSVTTGPDGWQQAVTTAFPGATFGSDGFGQIPGIGEAYGQGFPWVWTAEHGWWYVWPEGNGTMWAWDFGIGWTWVDLDWYPVLWVSNPGGFVYYVSGQPERWFWRYDTQDWISVPR